MDVRLSADAAGRVSVEVKYQLEVNQLIALLDAKILLEQRKEEEPGNAKAYYEAFARLHAPLLADRIYARLDGAALDFTSDEPIKSPEFNKKDGTLHCEFVFRASARPNEAEKHVLTFEEGAYKEEAGRVLLSLHASRALNVLARDEPSAELKARSPADLKIGDDERMRHGSLTFTLPAPSALPPPLPSEQVQAPAPASKEDGEASASSSLLDLLFQKDEWFVLSLLGAAAWGAAHALTPGHGKTLVAAYLVGERGTVLHALFLGLMTTLSHTGAVIVLALVLCLYPYLVGGAQFFMTFLGGLLVVVMGFWLLYRRLAGQADHFHLFAGHHHHDGHGHHHHDHGIADHYHDERGDPHPLAGQGRGVGLWNLALLGLAGGIVPCTDAIALLVAAVGNGYMTRALPLLLAFSAGLASVLIVIGMLVVTSKRFAGSHFGESRLFRALPVLSALLVTGLGLWLCYDAVHGGITPLGGKP